MRSTKLKQTEIGKIPEDWEVKSLGEIGFLRNGINYNRNDIGEGLQVVSVKQLFRGELVSFNDLEVVKKDSISHWENYLLKEGDMLFARGSLKREGAGKLALVRNLPKEDIVFSGFTILFRNESENDNLFLNYLLRSPRYRELFPRIAVGTTITNLNQEILRSVPIILPPLPEQKAIAKILSDLDAKIELNNKMNRTLEAIGQALFKKWFIDNPEKENWVEKPLDNLFTLEYGWHLPEWDRKPGEYPVFGSGGLTGTHDNFFVEGPGIIIGRAGKIGPKSVYYSHINFCPLETAFYVKSGNKRDIPFIYFFLKNLDVVNTGSSVPNLSRRDIHTLFIHIPDRKTVDKFYEVVYKLLEKIHKNNFQNQKLAQIRDALLPKLMSGDIRVK